MQERTGYDVVLLATALILCVAGAIFVLSASAVHSAVAYRGDAYAIFQSHVIRLLIGLAFMIAFSVIDYHVLGKMARVTWLLTFVALIVVLFLPQPNGATAHRWIYYRGFSFQPAELAKFAIISYLATRLAAFDADPFLADRKKLYTGTLLIVGVTAGLVVIEPNLSMTLMILVVAAMLFFVSGVSLKPILSLGGICLVPLALISWLTPYMQTRLTTYADALFHPLRASYHVKQSLVGIGQGGIAGVGLGASMQKNFFLPEPFKDFIFSIVGEELGILGALFVLAGFTIFISRAWHISVNAPDRFGYYLGMGITLAIAVSVVVNIGVTLGLLPTTGQPLPFVSYGGSSLVMNLAAVGVLLNISRQTQRQAAVHGSGYPYL
ncbi:putative lipid II flippase FtsW [bacterium]|nr:putative lipid II flippase FtsW [bacterium]